jgi:hypothetical protein
LGDIGSLSERPKNRKLLILWLRGLDLNQRPLGYEPNELPGCSTPHSHLIKVRNQGQCSSSQLVG